MKFSVGDKVRFLNDVGGGVVKKIIDAKTVMVLIDEGFDVPVPIQDIIKVEEESTKLSKSIKIPAAKEEFEQLESFSIDKQDEMDPETISKDDDVRVHFALVLKKADKAMPTVYQAYIINDCNYKLLYHVSLKQSRLNYRSIKQGFIEANTKIHVADYSIIELNKNPEFLFQFILFKKDSFVFHEPAFRDLNIKPVEINDGKVFQATPFFKEKAVIFHLIESKFKKNVESIPATVIKKVISEKDPVKVQVKEEPKPLFKTIDLHIHELIEDETGLSPSDMLDLQIIKFKKELETSIKMHEKKVVFIHGKGNGRLRHEIRHLLDTEYKTQCVYQDASFQEYGFGATLVILK